MRRDHSEDLGVDGRIILEWLYNEFTYVGPTDWNNVTCTRLEFGIRFNM